MQYYFAVNRIHDFNTSDFKFNKESEIVEARLFTSSVCLMTKSSRSVLSYRTGCTSNAHDFQKQFFGNTFFIQNLELCIKYERTAIDATRKLATEAKYTLRFFSNESKIRNFWQLFDFLYKQVTIENRHFSYADGNLTVTALMREPKHRRKMLSVLLESKQHISSSSSILGVYSVTLVLYYNVPQKQGILRCQVHKSRNDNLKI